MSTTKSKILIVGASSNLASLLTHKLKAHYTLIGVDLKNMPKTREFPGEFHKISYMKNDMEDLFKEHKFSAIVHLGRIPSTAKLTQTKRMLENTDGARNILDLAHRHGTKNYVILSTHLIYGARRQNHLYIKEKENRYAASDFPELADSVEFDHTATEFMLEHTTYKTTILRPAFIIGPHIKSPLVKFLQNPFCPKVMGYDPLIQIIHENDMVDALLLAVRKKKKGIFNVAGEGVLPVSSAIELAGSQAFPIPTFLMKNAAQIYELSGTRFPAFLMDYLRYPVVVSDSLFKETFGYEPKIKTSDALKSLSQTNV